VRVEIEKACERLMEARRETLTRRESAEPSLGLWTSDERSVRTTPDSPETDRLDAGGSTMLITIIGATERLRAAAIKALQSAFSEIPDIRLKLQWSGMEWRVLEVRPFSSLPFPGSTPGDIEAALVAAGLPVARAGA
jgi:hypothetical protein